MLLRLEDHRRIERAVAEAERTTRGQIVCVVADEAGPYAEVALAWAAASALVLPLAALAVAGAARHFDYALGGWSAAQIAAVHGSVLTALTSYALVQCMLFLSLFLIVSIPPVRRLMTPPALKRARVSERAREEFVLRGLDKTAERTGILIFVSLYDRRAEVFADSGINAKVAPSAWDEVVQTLVGAMSRGKTGDAFVAAIEQCGRILAQHFPARPGQTNELADTLTELPPSSGGRGA